MQIYFPNYQVFFSEKDIYKNDHHTMVYPTWALGTEVSGHTF